VGAILVPALAAIAAIVAFITRCTIIVVKK